MDSSLNPYAPGSGLTPPSLEGRDEEIAAADLTMARARSRRPARGIVLYGLRGVGKTVLLNKFRDMATRHGWLVCEIEGRGENVQRERVRLVIGLLRAVMNDLHRRGASVEIDRAVQAILSLAQTHDIRVPDIGISLTPGVADSGHFDVDLEEAVELLSIALRQESRAIGVFIDEMQELDSELLSILLAVQHRAGQQEWPFFIFGAGLPGLPARLGDLRSYAERLFDYRDIGPLDPKAAREALVLPASVRGLEYDPAAADILLDAAGGYPYFIQTYGRAAWDAAASRSLDRTTAELALAEGNEELDSGFFSSRWERVSPMQREYLHAMADLNLPIVTTKAIAERIGKPLSKLSVVRQAIIEKGLVWAPERGGLAFTLPGMAGYIRRQIDS